MSLWEVEMLRKWDESSGKTVSLSLSLSFWLLYSKSPCRTYCGDQGRVSKIRSAHCHDDSLVVPLSGKALGRVTDESPSFLILALLPRIRQRDSENE